MEREELYKLFEDKDFDLAELPAGHKKRFSHKLEVSNLSRKTSSSKVRSLWGPIISIAACVLIIFLAGNFILKPSLDNSQDLGNISPEMAETQNFYLTVINAELDKIKSHDSPETKNLVDDAKGQLTKLDKEYKTLKRDLVKSGRDKRVVFAMISNLQQRIELLKTVISTIEYYNQQKNNNHEKIYI